MRYLIAVLSILLLVGCQPLGKTEKSIKFEVRNFELKYEKNEYGAGGMSEVFNGKGNIVATGDQNEVKKPYLVLLKTTKLSGGSPKDASKEFKYYHLVYEGLGEFGTYDYNNDKTIKFERPEYKFEVIGYLPFILQSTGEQK